MKQSGVFVLSEKQKRVLSWVVFVLVILVAECCCFAVFITYGNDAILSYIDNVENMKTRDLAIEKDAEGYWTITNDETDADFKILNISDIHFCCGYFTYNNDVLAVDSIVQLVKNNRPDLIVLMGDINSPIWIRSWCTNAELQTKAIARLFTNIGIPWAVVFGNHDDEGNMTRQQLANFYGSIDGCLFMEGPQNITGYGNYVIKLKNHDGTINSGLILMDSNSYAPKTKYDHFHQDQIDWYETQITKLNTEAGFVVKTLLYMHMPFLEYRTAINLYNSGSEEVEFVGGDKNERVSNSPETGFFNKLLELNSTKNVFCGHDHEDNFTLIYKGVSLSFCAAIDTSTYFNAKNRTDYRGALVVSISKTSTVDLKRAMQKNGFSTTDVY